MSVSDVRLIERIAEFRHDPVGFVRYVFPWGEVGSPLEGYEGPRKWQEEVMGEVGAAMREGKRSSLTYRLAIASGHDIGKTSCLVWLLYWAMSTHIDCRGVVTANKKEQLLNRTWPELAKWYNLSLNRDWFRLTATSLMSVQEGHEKTWMTTAETWSENNMEGFQGLHNEGKRLFVIMDESSVLPDKLWEVTENACRATGTEVFWLAFGNPTSNTGRFKSCFTSNRWHTKQIDRRDVEGANLEEIAKEVEEYGEDSDYVRVRIRGVFPRQSARQFISSEDVDAAYGRVLRDDQYKWSPKIISVDPAWTGEDEFVIGMRQGLSFRILRVIPYNDNDVQMANLIGMLEDEEGADAVFIDGGFGTGIVSIGRTLNRNWQLVWFSEKPIRDEYMNKRSEMWGEMKKWLKEGGSIPKDQGLYQELIGPELVARMDGKIQLESKEQMKRRQLGSPNRADCLCLVAGTLIRTPAGEVPIEDIRVGDEVVTPFGVTTVGLTWESDTEELTTVGISGGRKLVGKPDHRIFVWGSGKVPMDGLQLGFELEPYSPWRVALWNLLGKLGTGGLDIGFSTLVDIMRPEHRYTAKGFCTAVSGLRNMVRYQTRYRSIIKMAMDSIIALRILRPLALQNTAECTCCSDLKTMNLERKTKEYYQKQLKWQKNGTDQKRVGNGILTILKRYGKRESQKKKYASIAGSSTGHISQERQNIVPLHVRKSHAISVGFTSRLSQFARGVARIIWQIAMRRQSAVVEHVQTDFVQATKVYNLTLRKHNAYYANGILVFNCLSFAYPVAPRGEAGIRGTDGRNAGKALTEWDGVWG